MDLTLADRGARANRCDIAPSRFARIDHDGYFTIDADWIVPALCRAVHVDEPILEPCAVADTWPSNYARSGSRSMPQTFTTTKIRSSSTSSPAPTSSIFYGYRFIVTKLPYEDQVAILAHILPIVARDGCSVAVLARSEWRSAQDRRALVHDDPHFAGEVVLMKRPIWIRRVIKSPRHWLSWYVWSPVPRMSDRDPFSRFAGVREGSRNDGQNEQDRRAEAERSNRGNRAWDVIEVAEESGRAVFASRHDGCLSSAVGFRGGEVARRNCEQSAEAKSARSLWRLALCGS